MRRPGGHRQPAARAVAEDQFAAGGRTVVSAAAPVAWRALSWLRSSICGHERSSAPGARPVKFHRLRNRVKLRDWWCSGCDQVQHGSLRPFSPAPASCAIARLPVSAAWRDCNGSRAGFDQPAEWRQRSSACRLRSKWRAMSGAISSASPTEHAARSRLSLRSWRHPGLHTGHYPFRWSHVAFRSL